MIRGKYALVQSTTTYPETEIQLCLLALAHDVVSGRFQAPSTLFPGRSPPLLIKYKDLWAREAVRTLYQRGKNLSLSVIEPVSLDRPTASLVIISNKLS
jgi:hypothetical protein